MLFRNPLPQSPLNCHHGHRVGSVCVCDNGWKTDITKAKFKDVRFIVHWCNEKIKVDEQLAHKVQRSLLISVSYLLLLLLLLIIDHTTRPESGYEVASCILLIRHRHSYLSPFFLFDTVSVTSLGREVLMRQM